eukprot:CAMPEP_0172187646 /NCGR_PEP_ID=MMETSP1050-20130122/21460_1 /TAXON_ID=233186 /ORGANISM="Cryptomonas curvata, Strain CCAP979/52" /LENGTH=74 /DNA_ID=CAMNT_0012862005 /DNA_START=392 /DNA_END=616 /DNA_ORIENTATION=-
MEKLHPLRRLAVLIPRLARCPLQGRGGEQRDQQLPGAEAPQVVTNSGLSARRRDSATSSDPGREVQQRSQDNCQ